MVHVPPCPLCTGKRRFCIHRSYPLPANPSLQKRIAEKLKKEMSGPSYSIFVGHNYYPNLNVGPMTGIEIDSSLDNPHAWFGLGYGKIIELRSMLVRSKQKVNIFSRSRFVQEQQELVIAKEPTDTEITFKKTPVYNFTLSEHHQPMGPSGLLEKLRITENVKVRVHVEKVVNDEMLANEACGVLYSKGEDVYKISSILSSGILGREKSRKLVPSRWSTTASHDIVAKRLMEKIRDFSSINEFRVYSSLFLDNHFEVLLMPGSWEFENFEVWAGHQDRMGVSHNKHNIIPEYEPFHGRASYAEGQAGGYYASRLGVCEGLASLGRQARAVVFREVYEGYTIPVGVWQVLENVRNAFNQPFMKFDTKEEALSHIRSMLRVPLAEYVKLSKVLGQRKLIEF